MCPPECDGGVVAQVVEHDVLAAGVELQEAGHLVHAVVDHGPAVLGRVVPRHLRQATAHYGYVYIILFQKVPSEGS